MGSGTGTVVYLSVNSDAIDASFATKREGLMRIVQDAGRTMGEVGVIGDSANDLPFLLEPEVRISAAPANAQSRVKQIIGGLPQGLVLEHEGLEGFLEFYETCRRIGVRLIVSDRDGVLKWKNDAPFLSALRNIYTSMGRNGDPLLVILTGSSAEQNYRFLTETAIGEAVSVNPVRYELPPLIYAENGGVLIDISSRTSHILEQAASKADIDTLLGPVRSDLIEDLSANILPKFGMTISTDQSDQSMKVYLPMKATMLTVNVPKNFANGDFFRDSSDAQRFRVLVGNAMESSLRRNNFGIAHL